jgi:transposase-like protein
VLVGGQWEYLYRAVDKLGQTVDFLLTARRDVAAARRFFERAIDLHDVLASVTIDKRGANTAAVRGLIADSGVEVPTTAIQAPEQPRRAGPPSLQEANVTDDGIQVLRVGREAHRRH